MFVRSAPHVIDFYADIATPLLSMAFTGDAPTDFEDASPVEIIRLVDFTGPAGGNAWRTEAADAPVLFRQRTFRRLTPAATTKLLRFATGELEAWPALTAYWTNHLASAPKSLRRGPGTILMTPQFMVDHHVLSEDQLRQLAQENAAAASLARAGVPFVVPYVITDTVALFSGQQLRGVGIRGSVKSPPTPNIDLTRKFPTLVFSPPADAAIDPRHGDYVLLRLGREGNGEEGVAERVVVQDLDLSVDDPLAAARVPPRTAVDLGNARHATIRRVSLLGFELGLRIEPTAPGRAVLNWMEECLIECRAPLTIGPNAEDCTIWGGRHAGPDRVAPTALGGVNSQMWFAVAEPTMYLENLPGPPYAISEVELGGDGCGVFSTRVEGTLSPPSHEDEPTLTRASFHRGDRVASIHVNSHSHLCHVSFCHVTTEGVIPVAIDTDSAAALTRHVPMRSVLKLQPELGAGLTNLLVNADFQLQEANLAPMGWNGSPNASFATTSAPQVHGLDSALQVSMPPLAGGGFVVGGREPAAIWQDLAPGPEMPIRTVADRTMVAGCWLLTLPNRSAAPPPRVPGAAGIWAIGTAFSPGGGSQALLGRSSAAVRVTELIDGDAIGRYAVSNDAVGSGWRFVSALLHTTPEATGVRFEVMVPAGGTCILSEPILADGVYLPPWHPRPASQNGRNAMMWAILPGMIEEVQLSRVGHLPGGDGGWRQPVASARLLSDGQIFAVRACIGRLHANEAVCCWLTFQVPGETPESLLPVAPWVIHDRGSESRREAPWSERVDLPRPLQVRPRMEIRLHVIVVETIEGRPTGVASRPSSRDITFTVGIRGRA